MTAWLAVIAADRRPGAQVVADAVDALTRHTADDGEQVVAGLGAAHEHALADGITRLVNDPDAGPALDVQLVLPVFGEPCGGAGEGGVGSFAAAAVDAQAGVVVDYTDTRRGIVPELDRRGSSYAGWRWRAFELQTMAAPQAPIHAELATRLVEQSERALLRALRDATEVLDASDLARWRPEVARGRAEAETAMRRPGTDAAALPSHWPAAARALAHRCWTLWPVIDIARADPGALSAAVSATRAAAMSALSRALREATMSAHNLPAASLLASQYRDRR